MNYFYNTILAPVKFLVLAYFVGLGLFYLVLYSSARARHAPLPS